MRLFILICFFSLCLRFLAFCVLLATTQYPRKTSYSAGSDVISLVWAIVFLVWAIKLLWL